MKILYTAASVISFIFLSIFLFDKTDLNNYGPKEITTCAKPVEMASLSQFAVANKEAHATWLFDTSAWPARWSCGEWTSLQGWTSILSDVVIFLSYAGIPVIILFFLYRTKFSNITFKKLLVLFILFILSCGFTHLVDAIIFWIPVYNLSLSLKLITAVISAITFFSLITAIPKLLEFKSPQQLEKIITKQTNELANKNTRLEHEIIERKKVEDNLKLALKNNQDLYQENQHRMKNNLQMISSLLYLRALNKSDQVKLDFQEIAERIASIKKVDELLLSEEPYSEIAVADYFKKITHELTNIYHTVKVDTEIDIPENFKFVASYAMNCGLIYSEFFSNSIKHAFGKVDKPKIKLSFEASEDDVTMIIEDNGSGYDTSIKHTGSFGVGLIESFIRQLNGTRKVKSAMNEGTSLAVMFNVATT